MHRGLIGLALVLAGCAAGARSDSTLPAVRPVAANDATLPVARGEVELVARVVSPTAPGADISGATCTATSPYFSASFTPPARLLLPDYGAASPSVTVSCRAGSATGSALVAPEAVWSGGVGGWPAVGISVGTGNRSGVGVGLGWWGGAGAGASTGVPVTRYPAVRIPLQ
jgi:hypothetical protein